MKVIAIAMQLLSEAFARKWVLALIVGITLLLGVLLSALRLEVVDGALAATRLFGSDLGTDIRAVDVALRPVFRIAAYLVFYGGLILGILSSADFGSSLLTPGRIGHLLAQPVRRWELLVGTWLGVVTLLTVGGLYGAVGFTAILGMKTGVWTSGTVVSALLMVVVFASIYSAMLLSSVLVQNTPLGILCGAIVFVGGVFASHRDALAAGFDSAWAEWIFDALTMGLPRISTLADYAADIGGSAGVPWFAITRLLVGSCLFGMATLSLGVWFFERKDF